MSETNPEITVRGVVAKRSEKSQGLFLLPEDGSEGYWLNFNDHSPPFPSNVVRGASVEVTWVELGTRRCVNHIDLLACEETPVPRPPRVPPPPPLKAPEALSPPPAAAGVDRATLRLFARVQAMDLALRLILNAMPDAVSDAEVIERSKPLERHLLAALEEPPALDEATIIERLGGGSSLAAALDAGFKETRS